jgi:hypothetical protein
MNEVDMDERDIAFCGPTGFHLGLAAAPLRSIGAETELSFLLQG